MRVCEQCKNPAQCYAMDPPPGGWGGWYCYDDVPRGFVIVDRIDANA